MQDSLIPNTVFLIPLLEQISELGGPVQVEKVVTGKGFVVVTSWDGIEVEVDGIPYSEYKITVTIEGVPTTFACDNETPLSPFHEAWLCHALKRNMVKSGYKVKTEHKTEKGIELFAVDAGSHTTMNRTLPESLLIAEAWLATANVATLQTNRQTTLFDTQAAISTKREENRQAELERQRAEQDNDSAALS